MTWQHPRTTEVLETKINEADNASAVSMFS